MIITEENRPRCKNFERCGNYGLTLLNGSWYCGECLTKYLNKLKEMREKIMMEE